MKKIAIILFTSFIITSACRAEDDSYNYKGISSTAISSAINTGVSSAMKVYNNMNSIKNNSQLSLPQFTYQQPRLPNQVAYPIMNQSMNSEMLNKTLQDYSQKINEMTMKYENPLNNAFPSSTISSGQLVGPIQSNNSAQLKPLSNEYKPSSNIINTDKK